MVLTSVWPERNRSLSNRENRSPSSLPIPDGLGFTHLHTLGVKGRVLGGLRSWGRGWSSGSSCGWLGSLLLRFRLLGRHVVLGAPVEVRPKKEAKEERSPLREKREDWKASPCFYPGQEPPQRGRVSARATAAGYKRKKQQQGAADISVLSPVWGHQFPLHPPTPIHTPHSSQPAPLEQMDSSLPIGGNQRGGRKTDPLLSTRVVRER